MVVRVIKCHWNVSKPGRLFDLGEPTATIEDTHSIGAVIMLFSSVTFKGRLYDPKLVKYSKDDIKLVLTSGRAVIEFEQVEILDSFHDH